MRRTLSSPHCTIHSFSISAAMALPISRMSTTFFTCWFWNSLLVAVSSILLLTIGLAKLLYRVVSVSKATLSGLISCGWMYRA